MNRSESPNDLLSLSVAPLLSGLFLLIVAGILWYYGSWTTKETALKFLLPIALLIASFIMMLLSFAFKRPLQKESK